MPATSPDREGSAVRIEFDSESSGASPTTPADVVPTADHPRFAPRLWLIGIAVGVVAMAGAVLALQPDSGTDATGAPITSTTEPPPSTSEPVVDESAAEPSSDDNLLAAATEPADIGDIFVFEVIESSTGGWVAHGFAEDDQLFRSVDGLEWSPIDRGNLPGTVVGLDRDDSGWIAVIDGEDLWASNQSFEDTDDFTMTVWRSADLVSWTRADEFDSIEARGFPYPSQVRDDTLIALSLQSPGSVGTEVAADYLARFAEVPPGVRYCGWTVPGDSDDSVTFIPCDGEGAELNIGPDANVDVDELVGCFQLLNGEFEVPELTVRHQPIGDAVLESTAPFGGAISLAAIPGGWASTNPAPEVFGFGPAAPDCDDSTPVPEFDEEGLVWWTRDDGYQLVPLELAFGFGQTPEPVVVDDGRAVLVPTTQGAATVDLATGAVDIVREPPAEWSASALAATSRALTWSISDDGRAHAVGVSGLTGVGEALWLAIDDGPWLEVDPDYAIGNPRLLMAMGTSIWIQNDFESTITRFDLSP